MKFWPVHNELLRSQITGHVTNPITNSARSQKILRAHNGFIASCLPVYCYTLPLCLSLIKKFNINSVT